MLKKSLLLTMLFLSVCILFVAPTLINSYSLKQGVFYTFLERHEYFKETAEDQLLKPLTDMRMRINGTLCAYDIDKNTYYYPLPDNINEGDLINFDITFGIRREKIYINNAIIKKKTKIPVAYNHPYKVEAVTRSTSHNYSLIFTRLPIVMLLSKDSITTKDASGFISVIDPNYKNNNQKSAQIISSAVVAVRGGISHRFDKKSYKFELIDAKEDEINYPLLGMRNDGDWILDALYNDASKMRKKVSMDIWSEMSTVYYDDTIVNGVDGQYVEVFINDRYNGLYLLRERIDQKQLSLSDNEDGVNGGIMYKSINWGTDGSMVISFTDSPFPPEDPDNYIWSGLESVFPRPQNVDNINWFPFYNLSRIVVEANDTSFTKEISSLIDYNNVAEYFLFVNLIKGEDNIGKNIFWSIADTQDSQKSKLMMTAWDLDATFGRDWQNYDTDSNYILFNGLFERLFQLNSDNFVDLVQNKWISLRNNIISYENIERKFESEYDFLYASGALDREADRWNEFLKNNQDRDIYFYVPNVASEKDYILEWTQERLKYLDNQIIALQEKYKR